MTGQAVCVRWIYSSTKEAQVDTEDLPEPTVMLSIGWLALENESYIVLARDTALDPKSYRWRSNLAIPRIAIEQITTLEDAAP